MRRAIALQRAPVRGDYRTIALKEVPDHGKLGVGVRGGELLGAPDQLPEDLGVALGGQLGWHHDHPSAIAWVGPASDVAGALKVIDHGRDPACGETQGLGQLRGSQPAGAPDDFQAMKVCTVQRVTIGRKPVQPVDLCGKGPQLREHALNQRAIRGRHCLTI